MIISIIAAIGKNNELGLGGKLPWSIPSDSKNFRKLTSGHTVIMGRKTHQSIGRPLPNRTNIVITRDNNFSSPSCLIASSLELALQQIPPQESEAFIIGGANIYELSLPLANKMYISHVDASPEADTFFPLINEFEWNITHDKKIEVEGDEFPYTFRIYEKKI